jgi:hypothetical protein
VPEVDASGAADALPKSAMFWNTRFWRVLPDLWRNVMMPAGVS